MMKKRVAGYIRMKQDIIQEVGIALEAKRMKEWISNHPDWECAGVYVDQQPRWEAFSQLARDCRRENPVEMIVLRSMRRFEQPGRIKELPCPVFVEDAGIYATDELWPEYLKALSSPNLDCSSHQF